MKTLIITILEVNIFKDKQSALSSFVHRVPILPSRTLISFLFVEYIIIIFFHSIVEINPRNQMIDIIITYLNVIDRTISQIFHNFFFKTVILFFYLNFLTYLWNKFCIHSDAYITEIRRKVQNTLFNLYKTQISSDIFF